MAVPGSYAITKDGMLRLGTHGRVGLEQMSAIYATNALDQRVFVGF